MTLSAADRDEALALEGASPFDPMGNGALRSDKVQLPEAIMDDAAGLRRWVKRSFDYAVTLPKKTKGAKAKKQPSAKPAKKPARAAAKRSR